MSDCELKQKLTDDMKAAMRAKDKARLGVIRLALAAIKQREVDERISLNDTQILAVLDKMIKQCRDSLNQYQGAGREDLAQQERFEIEIMQQYLPAALSESELDSLVTEVVAATGAQSMKDMGRVMSELRPKVQGRTDMGLVSQKVRQTLAD